MKRKLFCGLLLALGVTSAYAQQNNVGIGTTAPDKSAVLEIQSTTKGLLTPRLTLDQRDNIPTPATGLLIYQTDFLSGFYFYNGTQWKGLSAAEAKSVAGVDGDWTIVGNSGTDPNANFIGTLDNKALRFRTNSNTSGFLSGDDGTLYTYFGYRAGNRDGGAGVTGIANTAFGFKSLTSVTTGQFNMALGAQALLSNTTGGNNIAIGTNSMSTNQSGSLNVSIGADALGNNMAGSGNIAIGNRALKGAAAANPGQNIAIGADAGLNASGNGNIFFGVQAGQDETGNGKLYISNGGSPTPLVYGDFVTKYLAVGEVSVADRAAAGTGGYRLLVKGGMMTEKIKVALTGSTDWADYVFEDDYKMMSLEEVESFVKANKHLPNVPSTTEVLANGLDVAKTDAKLLEKIEELTLYMIQMNKEVKQLKVENAELKKSFENK